jgi:hypothetical protein
VDARQRGVLGGCPYRSRGPGLLAIRALANFGDPPQDEVPRIALLVRTVNGLSPNAPGCVGRHR